MGKNKIDRLQLIENVMSRNIAFCKRKRGFLKKAIELSSMCAQDIFIVIADKHRKRVIQFNSQDTFQIKEAYSALKEARSNKLSFEQFENKDY